LGVWIWRGLAPMGLAVNSLDAGGLPAVVQRMAVCTLVAAYVVVAAIGLGLWVARVAKLRLPNPWERLALCAGLGLGILSLLVLGLGLAGLLSPAFWVLVLGVFILISLVDLFDLFGELRSDFAVMRPKGTFEWWVAIALIGVFAVNFLAAFIPPLDYDVLEYHLGSPAQYARAGRIFFIQDNVYGSFPANVEMLFLLAIKLSGGAIAGAYTSKLLNVALGMLAAIGVWRLGARLFTRRVGAVSAAIFYSAPWVSVVTEKAYVEVGLALFGVLAMLSAARYWVGPAEHRKWREAAAAGIFAGLAMGTKYPAAVFVLAPLGLFFVVVNLRLRGLLLKHGLVFGICALVAVSPWLVKNYVYTGNPTYPLLYGIFDGHSWDSIRNARFVAAHSPGRIGAGEFGLAFTEYFFSGELASPLLIVFAPFFLLYPIHGRRRLALFAYAAFVLGAWFLLTHRIPRFLVPMIPALALLGGCGIEADLARWWRGMCRALCGILLVYCAFIPWRINAQGLWFHKLLLGVESPKEYMDGLLGAAQSSYSWKAIDFVNRLPRESKVLFLGEARTFYVTRPVIAPTVFDEKLTDRIEDGDKSGRDLWELLRGNGIDYVYVNGPEFNRLQDTYAFLYQGEVRGGYSDWLDASVISEMEGKYLRRVAAYSYSGALPVVTPFVIYRVVREKEGKATADEAIDRDGEMHL